MCDIGYSAAQARRDSDKFTVAQKHATQQIAAKCTAHIRAAVQQKKKFVMFAVPKFTPGLPHYDWYEVTLDVIDALHGRGYTASEAPFRSGNIFISWAPEI